MTLLYVHLRDATLLGVSSQLVHKIVNHGFSMLKKSFGYFLETRSQVVLPGN